MSATATRLGLLVCLTLLVGCDHATKLAAKAGLEGHAPHQLIRGVLDLRYRENTDVAFNLLRAVPEHVRAPLLVAVGGIGALVLLGLLLLRRGEIGLARIALLLVTAGALANYVDRLARGYVVDFVHVPHWPVFNVADAYVTVGGLLLGWYALRARDHVRGGDGPRESFDGTR
jgi:signal peptidase II